jgi:hypothetical protein
MADVILFPTLTMYMRLVFNSDLGKLENEEWMVAMNIPMHLPPVLEA